ncbi:Kef-type potassium/proton antiporter, CPA2 family (TC 2.A.37.1) [Cohaesibacter sp. ES.047]|uniref:cation:proton antiporter domain-containing protein n=1 Tax=Cohaesibacter sp. ES.047 TaxID=1798205 RepID=UPI000BB9A472|nr:cation:proton antiporter [Cohaesibacter sp. ES.047]SNY91233.1 Kef-type potassium/proton antiporter, CPA2 family (TC 2.A.37.1) [Cohaesibacter sp. ES.047]
MSDFLLISFMLLVAGVIAVPITSRLGLGSVMGYLIAGMLLEPILSALSVDVESLQHFAEFGVVIMLFLVGLELEPRLLWRMKSRLLGLGGLQLVLTTLLLMSGFMALDYSWPVSLAIGAIFAMSSTAIVLQTLSEKGLMKSDGGKGAFSILLFQDIAFIPMVALLPLLALPELGGTMQQLASDAASAPQSTSPEWISSLPIWWRVVIIFASVGLVVFGGRFLTRPMFRFIAMGQLRELFVAAALMLVVGIALMMSMVGLSPALGTFVAGVVLANSEYRHELESDVEPLKGLLLGLFFITVGANVDFSLLLDHFFILLGITLGVMVVKLVVIYCIAFLFGIRGADRWLVALGLAQAGEFGFVLLSYSVANGVIDKALSEQLLLVVTLSMVLTPALFILYDRVIAPRFVQGQAREDDDITEKGQVIIAGHGRFGGAVNRILRTAGYSTVVLDHSSVQLDTLRTYGIRAFFGDATRPDLLRAAGIEDAAALVIAIDNAEQTTELVRYMHEAYPHVHVVARAMNRHHVYELYAVGCRDIIRDTFDSAVRTGRSVLEALGMHPYDAEKHVQDYEASDKRAIAELARLYDPEIPGHQNAAYVEKTKEVMADQEQALKEGKSAFRVRAERGWLPPGHDGSNED